MDYDDENATTGASDTSVMYVPLIMVMIMMMLIYNDDDADDDNDDDENAGQAKHLILG